MHPEIMKILANTHPDTNYTLFPVHHVRALVAIVQMLTEIPENTRQPLLDIRFCPIDTVITPHTQVQRGTLYQVTINKRYIGTLQTEDWRALVDILDPLTIPYEISIVNEDNNLGMNYVRR